MARSQNDPDTVSSIRAFYEAGRECLKKEHRGAGRPKISQSEKEVIFRKYGVIPALVNKARLFADEKRRGYSPAEVKTLCEAVRACQSEPGGKQVSFSQSHVIILLRLERGPDRDALQQEAIRSRWSKAELVKEVRRRKLGRKASGGRRRNVGAGRDGVIAEIDLECDRFVRLIDQLDQIGPGGKLSRLGEVSEPYAQLARHAADTVKLLRNETRRLQRRRAGLRGTRVRD